MRRQARAGRTSGRTTDRSAGSTGRSSRLLAAVTAAALALVLVDAVHPLGPPAVVVTALLLAALAATALLRRESSRAGASPAEPVVEPVLEHPGSVAQPQDGPADARPGRSRDELTGLADRAALTCALSAVLSPGEGPCSDDDADAADDLSLVALLLVDLDAFKELNDRFGHGAGDSLLRRTAARIVASVPPSALVARLGGDEFAVLLRGSHAAQARLVADEVAAAISAPAPEDGAGWRTTASIGLAFDDGPVDEDEELWVDPALAALDAAAGPDDAEDDLARPAALVDAREVALSPAEDLLRRVEVAMYSAKATGGGVRLYDPAHDLAARERALLAEELRAALATECELDRSATAQVVVFYQPQVEAATGAVGGLEALVRWRHPRHGLVSPDVFLEIVEEQGLVISLTERVMRTALLDARQWHDAGYPVRIAVNVSSSCLTSPALLPMVDAALEESGVDPALLVVEVTETLLMAEPHQALATARRLRARGVQLSIDDYGTGYSSLSYLSDLPATELKLDRAFTLRVANDPAIGAIVATTVDLAHRLGLRLVVEGVEDEEALAAVVGAGADETQGYLHGRPAPAASVVEWLTAGRARSESAQEAAAGARRERIGEDVLVSGS